MIKWHKITEGEGDESYPHGYALIAVELEYSKKIETHVGCYYRQYEEESCEDALASDFTDYNEADDTYYTPKGWYQEGASDEYSGFRVNGVVAWAELPKYKD